MIIKADVSSVILTPGETMKGKLPLFAVLAVLAVFLLTSCGPKKVEASVDMTDFKFTPDSLTVPAGSEVTLDLSNSGTLEHEYVIMVLDKQATLPFDADDEPNIYWEKELEKGESESVTFTAPAEPGNYQVVCGTAGHLEQGMQAELIVTE
jgi:uncharacterized cupredoxin-like copper-binding protein